MQNGPSLSKPTYPLFVKRDLDGFFGLFVDNLVQLLLIVSLCSLCGIGGDSEILVGKILPGVAISILVGNVFYAWQAHRLAKREMRDDVTALPYGINTPSLLVFIFYVMVPVYKRSGDNAELAWQMGMIACLGSGVIELIGALIAEKIRQWTPRAALLSTLAGIAIGFISMTFALEIFQRPLVSMLPLAIVLLALFANARFPGGLPGGFVAILAGTLTAWLLTGLSQLSPEATWIADGNAPRAWSDVKASASQIGWHAPQFAGADIWEVLSQPKSWLGFLSVIVPMGLFNVVGSLQNIESAEAAGDRFDTRSSLAANGIGTIVAAFFGSCFPTTIYIGHPGWKGLGARAGYSTVNGLVFCCICLTGTVGLINSVIPLEAGIAIVLWIGIIITGQAFQTTPKEHAPAVAMGLFPAIAAWGATVMKGTFATANGTTIQELLLQSQSSEVNGFLIHGLLVMEQGYIFTCMFLSAIAVALIDRRLKVAAVWSTIAATFSAIGLTHAYQIFGADGKPGNTVDYFFCFSQPVEGALGFHSYGIAIGYAVFAILFFAMDTQKKQPPQTN